MSKKTAENNISLDQHILDILTKNPDGLSSRDLAEAIRVAGYITRATDFLTVVRQKLYSMVQKGHVAKNGLQYTLNGATLENANLRRWAIESGDYALLREAVIDFAMSRGFRNPEAFPDMLISQRRQFVQAQKQYSELWDAVEKG